MDKQKEKMEPSENDSDSDSDSEFVGSYELRETLGRGNYCTVKHAIHVESGQNVAIKIIDKEKIQGDQYKNLVDLNQIEKNISVMEKFRHQNVVHLYEVISTETQLCLVMELVNGGKLLDKIRRTTNGRLTEPEARKYFQQLIYVLAFCHNSGITHRNLKKENLLMSADGMLKVSYFGLSALSQEPGKRGISPRIPCGSAHYRAPEVGSITGYDYAAADIWSCGVILFALLTGSLPFDSDNVGIVYLKTCAADFTCPSFFSPSVKRLIRRILDPNPVARITVLEILRDEWFSVTGDEPPIDLVAEQEHEAGRSTHVINNAYDDLSVPKLKFEPIKRLVNVLARRKRVFRTQLCGSKIIAKFEKPLDRMNLHSKRIDVEIEGGYGPRLDYISAKVKITPSFYPFLWRVRIKKKGGDARDFDRFHRDLHDAVKDIIWNEDNNYLPKLEQ